MRPSAKFICAAAAMAVLAVSALTANGAPGDLFASVNGTGANGGGFIYRYSPNGEQNTFASGLSRPRGLALTVPATCLLQRLSATPSVIPRF